MRSEQPKRKLSKTGKRVFAVLIGILVGIGLALTLFLQKEHVHAPSHKDSVATNVVSDSVKAQASLIETSLKEFYTNDSMIYLDPTHVTAPLDSLEAQVKAIKASDSAESSLVNELVGKVDTLNKKQTLAKKVNDLFTLPILNGDKLTEGVKLKDSAEVNDEKVEATDGFYELVNAAIDMANSLKGHDSAAAASDSVAKDSTVAPKQDTAKDTGASGQSGTDTSAAPTTTRSGNELVGTNSAQVADASNPAWSWGGGIKEQFIATVQARGLVGSSYILEPAMISNKGAGIYNLYKADGTYMVSVNCKTGMFAGNAGKRTLAELLQ
jgi:hypothetical protein